ncbi:uncharacterized protein LOC144420775 [Styela clava]
MNADIISSPDLMKKPRGKVPKRSRIWEIFSVAEHDQCKAVCKECQTIVSRGGGTARSQCTTNLWNHVKNKHPNIFNEIKKFKEDMNRNQESKRSSITLAKEIKVSNSSKIWELFIVNNEDSTAVKCTECNTEITIDDENGKDTLWYHMMAYHPTMYAKYVNEAMENVVLSSKGRRSTVWNEFTQHPLDSCKVICDTCDTIVSRGTAKEKLNTTNMRRHLKGNHHINALHSKGLAQKYSPYSEDDEHESNYNLSSSDVQQELNEATLSKCTDLEVEGYQVNDSMVTESSDDDMNGNSTNSSNHGNFPAMGDIGDMMTNRQVDMVHTALLMNALYQQQQLEICCDFSIFVRNSSTTRKNLNIGSTQSGNSAQSTTEFKLHKCVIGTVSDKLRTAIESGSDSLTITGVDKDVMTAFIEIVYTGKLSNINDSKRFQLQDVSKVAEILLTPTVLQYLNRCYPGLSASSTIDSSLSVLVNDSSNSEKSEAYENIKSDNQSNIDSSRLLSRTPKVNKRKNYLPVPNENSRKRHKLYEDKSSLLSVINKDQNGSLKISSVFNKKNKDHKIGQNSVQTAGNTCVPSSPSYEEKDMEDMSIASAQRFLSTLIKSELIEPDVKA